MTPAEIAARQALLHQTEKFAATIRAELAEAGIDVSPTHLKDRLTIKDVVAETGKSTKTVRRWARDIGEKVGGVWYFWPADLSRVSQARRGRRP